MEINNLNLFPMTPMTKPAMPLNPNRIVSENNLANANPMNFSSMLQNAISEVEGAQRISDQMTVGMLLGSVDVHQATIAMEKASLTLRTFIQVRDKMLEAYQEVVRMQV